MESETRTVGFLGSPSGYAQADDERTVPSEATEKAERVDEQSAHGDGSRAAPEDEAAADQAREQYKADEQRVTEHYREMTEKGANAKGERRI